MIHGCKYDYRTGEIYEGLSFPPTLAINNGSLHWSGEEVFVSVEMKSNKFALPWGPLVWLLRGEIKEVV